jgi:hypothetical protein
MPATAEKCDIIFVFLYFMPFTVPVSAVSFSKYGAIPKFRVCRAHRVHTEWQWALSGVHSIMMVKSAQPGGGGGGARSPPVTLSTITSKVVVYQYAPAENADTLHIPISPLPLNVLCGHAI